MLALSPDFSVRRFLLSFRFFGSLCIFLLLLGLSACKSPRQTHPEADQIRSLIHTYFETWSKPDMEAYGKCFDTQARVYFKTKDHFIVAQSLIDFLHGQKMGHLEAKDKMVEVPNEIEILMDDQGAQAYVTWTLTKGKEVTTGVDLFTFVKTASGWKIITIIFYEDLPKKS